MSFIYPKIVALVAKAHMFKTRWRRNINENILFAYAWFILPNESFVIQYLHYLEDLSWIQISGFKTSCYQQQQKNIIFKDIQKHLKIFSKYLRILAVSCLKWGVNYLKSHQPSTTNKYTKWNYGKDFTFTFKVLFEVDPKTFMF